MIQQADKSIKNPPPQANGKLNLKRLNLIALYFFVALFSSLIAIFFFFSNPAYAFENPYQRMASCLVKYDQPPGIWQNSVKYSWGNAIYVGNNQNHYTILPNTVGYHHTINGRHVGQQTNATQIFDLVRNCSNDKQCSQRTLNALEWLERNCD